MTRISDIAFAWLRMALLCGTSLALVGAAPALARVGVTSATNGDPLGKPPAETERILRIGIDVQANEVIITHDNDRAHLVFLDGTSLTVGPNAHVVIDRFVYDPNTKTGELAVNATKGVLRLVGGKISKTNAITITTPSSTIGIRGGIGLFNVGQGKTTADFIFGDRMTVTGQGITRDVTRPGSQVIVNLGAPPSLPSLLPKGGLAAALSQLEGTSGSGSGGSSGGGNADQAAQSSGFSGNNSGQPQNPPGTPPGGGNPPNTNSNTYTQPVSQTNPASNPSQTPPDTTPSSSPTTTPTSKTTQTLKGFVGGLIVDSNGHGGRSRTTAPLGVLAKPGDLTISTDATTGTARATVIIRGVDGTISSPTVTLPVGGTTATSFFRDDATYLIGVENGRGTERQGDRRPTPVRDTTTIFSSGEVPSGAAPYVGPGTCTCDFLKFGEWESTVTYRSHHGHGPTRVAVITQAPWVAGTLAVQLPNTGSASFSGIMRGQAQSGQGAIRNVQGTYGMSYSWGAGAGSFNASFDNRSYTGAVASTGGVTFAGGFTGGNRVGTLAGAFNAAPGGSTVVGQSGQFGIKGPNYQASGVFAGSKNP